MSKERYEGEVAPPPGDGNGGPLDGQDREVSGSGGGESRAQLDNLHAQSSAGLDEMLAGILAQQEPAPEFGEYVERRPPALLFVLTGPSGVGKDVTLERMAEMGVPFHYVVTVTTRKQRPGEVHGKHYYFVSKEQYKKLLEE